MIIITIFVIIVTPVWPSRLTGRKEPIIYLSLLLLVIVFIYNNIIISRPIINITVLPLILLLLWSLLL